MNPIIALIIANSIWGAGAPIFKRALIDVPPFTLAFLRFAGATFIMLPFYSQFRQKVSARDLFQIAIIAIFGITINISFFFLGLQKAPSINAPIIGSSGPIFLYLLSILFLNEKFKLKTYSGMMLGLIGVLIIVLAPVFNGKVTITLGALEGNLFYVFSMVGALAHVFLAKSVGHRVKPVVFTFWFFLFGTASFIPLMLNELRLHPIITLSPFAIFSVYFGIILSSALAYFLFSYGESKVHVQELGLFSYIDPVAAVILASWILGEHPDNFFVIGSLLVSGGIYIAEGRIPWHPIHKHKSYRRQDILVVPAYQSDTKQN